MHPLLNANPGPEGEERHSTRLETAAGRAGSTVGSAVRTLGDLQSKVVEITSRIQSLNQQLRGMATEAGGLAGEWKHIGRLRLNEGREKVKELARNKPFHLLAAVATLAFCVGLSLRIWRSTRAD